MEIVRTTTYSKGVKRLAKLGASDADIEEMENSIAKNPAIGEVIPGTGGMRKVRFGYGDVGKSGGGRTVYYNVMEDERIYLLSTYGKVDQSDLTADEKRLLKKLVKELTDG